MMNARRSPKSRRSGPRAQSLRPQMDTRMSPETSGRRHRPDYLLVVAMVVLLAIGLTVMYSVSPAISAQLAGDIDQNHFMYRQILYLLLGFTVFAVSSMLPLKFWYKTYKYIIWFAIFSFLLLFIPALSLSYGGATRWVSIGPINYQPAELLKFGLIFYLALSFASRIKDGSITSTKTTNWFLALLAVVALEIVVIQKDLGTMVPIVAIMLSMLYLSGVKMRQVYRVGLILVLGVAVSILAAPHRMARVFTFLNPDSDVGGSGYHINQALIASGSGGLFGRGLGHSVQAYGYLPEAANDSIFAIMAEKFGFVGMIFVFAVYAVLISRMLKITLRAPDDRTRLIAGGITSWIAVQAFVNVGAMLGIMPLTGVTLPFLSFGGTSLVFTMIAVGVVFHISRYTVLGAIPKESKGINEDSTSRRRVGRSRYAA